MKRPKKATFKMEEVTHKIYTVTCPHCHTVLRGSFNPFVTLMLQCFHCSNPIDLRPPNKPVKKIDTIAARRIITRAKILGLI